MKSPALSPKIIILSDQVVFSGTSFVITLLVARSTDVAGFGVYSGYVLAIYLAVSAIGAWTIQPFQVLLGKTENVPLYTSFIVSLQLVLIVLVSVIIAAVMSVWFSQVPVSVVFFAIGFLFHDFGRKLLLALNKPIQTFITDCVVSTGLLIASVVFMLFGQGDIYKLMMLFSGAYLVSLVLILWYTRPFVIQRTAFVAFLKLHFGEGKWLFSTALVQWWSGNMFVVASGIYLGAAALGALRLGQSLFGVLNIILQTFENYVLPQTALRLKESQASALHFLSSISRKAGLLFIPILIVAFFGSTQIMILAGGQAYSEYGYVVRWLSILYIFIFISQPIRILIRSLLLNKHFFYGYVLSLVFALSMSHFLLSTYELNGAILGLIVSQLLLMVYWVYVLQSQKLNLWKSFTSF